MNYDTNDESQNENDKKVLQVLGLATELGLTREIIVERTGIARSTVYDALQRLKLHKAVSEYSEDTGKVGRPHVYFLLS